MTSKDGQEHSHMLTANAKLTLDGKACKAADLKPGTRIRVTTQSEDNRVTTQSEDNRVANRIEAIDKNLEFSIIRHDGKFVSVTGDKLTMTNLQGYKERSRKLNTDVKVTLDGKVCKPADLERGMKIRVTPESDDPHATVSRIEALDKNPQFASI
jgi:aspartate 1-decarboxylase